MGAPKSSGCPFSPRNVFFWGIQYALVQFGQTQVSWHCHGWNPWYPWYHRFSPVASQYFVSKTPFAYHSCWFNAQVLPNSYIFNRISSDLYAACLKQSETSWVAIVTQDHLRSHKQLPVTMVTLAPAAIGSWTRSPSRAGVGPGSCAWRCQGKLLGVFEVASLKPGQFVLDEEVKRFCTGHLRIS